MIPPIPPFVLAWLVRALPGLLIAGLALAFVAGVYQAGRNSAKRQCEAAALRAELAAVRADLALARAASEDAGRRAEALETQVARDRARVTEIEREAAHAPRPACALGVDDARRLRDIGTGTGTRRP